ncbi:transmembrane reductase CYB561D2-like [Arctopsyche grandis]|uniref:transmembrane reductase CYB561D2-like n=1 Tax=Arctopsyche grandis TaxID=121162 RepID=UPI00406D65A1
MVKNKLVESVKNSVAYSTWKLVLNTCIHMLNAVVFLQMVNFAVGPHVPRTKQMLHVIFSTLGYQLLMMEAIMTFNGNNSWSRLISRNHQKLVHLFIQLVASAFIIVGFSLAVSNKDDIKGVHFLSAHAILGLIGFIFTVISVMNGFMTFLFGKNSTTCSTFLKVLHNISGCVAIITGLCSLIFGIDLNFFRMWHKPEMVNTLIVFIAVCMGYILINPMLNLVAYLKSCRS